MILFSSLAILTGIALGQEQETEAVDLLINGDFDGEFITREGAAPRHVAEGWVPWHIPSSAASPSFANHDPNYDQENDRVRTLGGTAQKYFTLFATHQGGLYQRVAGLRSGTTYRFSLYGYVWSSSFEDADASEDPGDVELRVGIDPTGGTDGASPDIIWSTSATFYYDAYRQYAVIATAENDAITVFIESTAGGPRANNYIYVDDAALDVAIEAVFLVDVTPTPETLNSPTPTPTLRATATSAPSPTPTQLSVTHVVQEGDTVSALALAYDTTIDDIGAANQLNPRNVIFVGQRLLVPISDIEAQFSEALPGPSIPTPTPTATATVTPSPTNTPTPTLTPTPTNTPTPSPTPFTYQILRGDTLSSIGQRYGMTVAEIVALNGIFNQHNIDVGQVLVLATRTPIPTATPLPTNTPTPTPMITGTPSLDQVSTTGYIVQAGETLSDIAVKFETTVTVLIALNELDNPSRIYIGQVLQVIDTSETSQPTPTPTPTPVLHTVRFGDSLYAIALSYGVNMYEIAQLNGLFNVHDLSIGQVLIIPG
ncbi:MAG: LysM peptidoglycan-binding domain-containing protein [Chloroflexi bacterium]|nr:LysM peptidoglycan-binding domain-containing protein [Chloroflexota bacterium]